MAKRKTKAASGSREIVIRQAPAPRQVVVSGSRAVARRAPPSRRSSLLAGVAKGRSLMPVKETIQGGGGGVLAGLIDDAIPNLLVSGKKRGLVVFGVGAVLSWMVGLPPLVIAGLAGGVSRKMYDDFTST